MASSRKIQQVASILDLAETDLLSSVFAKVFQKANCSTIFIVVFASKKNGQTWNDFPVKNLNVTLLICFLAYDLFELGFFQARGGCWWTTNGVRNVPFGGFLPKVFITHFVYVISSKQCFLGMRPGGFSDTTKQTKDARWPIVDRWKPCSCFFSLYSQICDRNKKILGIFNFKVQWHFAYWCIKPDFRWKMFNKVVIISSVFLVRQKLTKTTWQSLVLATALHQRSCKRNAFLLGTLMPQSY